MPALQKAVRATVTFANLDDEQVEVIRTHFNEVRRNIDPQAEPLQDYLARILGFKAETAADDTDPVLLSCGPDELTAYFAAMCLTDEEQFVLYPKEPTASGPVINAVCNY